MALLLTHDVTLFDGVSQSSSSPALIELHSDRFILAEYVDSRPRTTETVMDVPLGELVVGGSMATLTFAAGGLKRRVDFSFAARAAMVGNAFGIFRTARLIQQCGINNWLAGFRALTVPVKYISVRHIVLWSLGGTTAIVAIATVYAIVTVSGGN